MVEKGARYPIGIQTFRDIVEGGYVYVDKTGYVANLAYNYRYVFLNRPRRFGKSLLSSTFHSFFAGEKELFDGLKAGEMNKEWKRHPVFHFDMSTAKHLDEKGLSRNIGYKLDAYEKEYGNDARIAREDINARLESLKRNYDGYHFCDESEDIYNPFSLIKSLNEKRFGSYWFESGTPTYMIERLEKNPIDESELERMTEVSRTDFDVSPEISENSLPMLYQTGYLTIKGYDPEDDSYTLGYPNREVKMGFLKDLLARYGV